MLHFTFLGTSSGVPSLTRNVSGLAIKNTQNKSWILIDAGEGTQHRIQQAKLSLKHLQAICITHVHGDHCYGLIGLLASTGMSGRTEPLTLVAPKEIHTWIQTTAQLTELYLPYKIQFIDVTTIQDGYELDNTLTLTSYPLHHRVPSYAFGITATHCQKKLDTQKLIEIGLPKGKAWGDLQNGHDVVHNEQTLNSKDYVTISEQRVHAVVGGDNDELPLLKHACQTADLLIHEATYTQEILEKVGAYPMHSSAKMVAEFAEQEQLPALILTHFSPRYHDEKGMSQLKEEIQTYYSGVFFMADDLNEYLLNSEGQVLHVK